jgi:hypothetical protein
MKALKWIGIGVGGLAAIVGAIFAVMFLTTTGAATAATDFLKLVNEDRYEEAYQATTPQFRKQFPLEKFREAVKLRGFETVSWHSREVSTSTGVTLEGTLKLRDGSTAIAIVKLEKIEGAWKVYSVVMRRSGAS